MVGVLQRHVVLSSAFGRKRSEYSRRKPCRRGLVAPITRTTGVHDTDHEGGWVAYGIGPLNRGPRGCRADGVVPLLPACGESLVGVGDKTGRRDREGGWLDLLAERLDEIPARETGPFGRVAERVHSMQGIRKKDDGQSGENKRVPDVSRAGVGRKMRLCLMTR
jgi:hypothetical protein